MTIMVQEVGAYINWAGMLVHMMKSKIVGINFKTGGRVTTDSVTLHGAPYYHLQLLLLMSITNTLDFWPLLRVASLQKSSMFWTKCDNARLLLKKIGFEQIIVIAFCPIFRYSAGLVD
jgi:hypothetical protein